MKLAEAMSLVKESASREGRVFRVFLACGFTPQHAQAFLGAHLARRLPARKIVIETGLYGDLAGNLERLCSQHADAAALMIEWEDLDPRLGYRSSHPWRLAETADMLDTVSGQLARLRARIERLAARFPVALVLPSLPLPPAFKAPGTWGDPTALALREGVYGFAAAMASQPMVRVVNPERLDQVSPPGERHDLRTELRWGIPYRLEHASAVGDLLSSLIAPEAPKKAIITDLDDTFWRGILGEDGVDAVSWDLEHSAHEHGLYQRLLAALSDLGILVGVATKNDPKLVVQAFSRKDLILSAERLFPVEAHWGAKSESVARILKTWHIGPDSVVFVDDSALELAEVKTAFPQIHCLLFPPAKEDAMGAFLDTLRDLCGKVVVTEEDHLRQPSLRAAAAVAAADFATATEDVLAQAQAEITLTYDRPDDRAFALINKTNQFNLNGRRVDESTWRARLADPRHFLITASYRDRFGPLGNIAVVAGRRAEREPLIDIWVMSCRAFSRRIEYQMLKTLFERLGVERLQLDLAATERNAPFRGFIEAIAGSTVAMPTSITRSVFSGRCPPLYARVSVV